MEYKLDIFCSIYQFMFIDLSLIILILTLNYNKTVLLRVPWFCLVLSYPVLPSMRDIFPQFSSLIDIDPVIPGLEFVPFSPVSDLIWFSGLDSRKQLFVVHSFYRNALRLVRSYYQPDEGGDTSTLGSCTCYHFGSRIKPLERKDFVLYSCFISSQFPRIY